MKFFILTLFVVGIGCSWASLLPPGCGDAVIRACNAARPYMTSEGKKGIDKLNEGVETLRQAILKGDIKRQSSLFKNVGARGMEKLAKSTTNACLEKAFHDLDKMDENASIQLQSVRDPAKAGRISCNTLDAKAKRLNKCNKK